MDSIAVAIASLEEQRVRIDAAITALRSLQPDGMNVVRTNERTNERTNDHVSAAEPRRPRAARTPAVGKGLDQAALRGAAAKVLAAVTDGADTLEAVAKHTAAPKANVSYHLRRLVTSGHVRAEGTTNSRRFRLAGKQPAKEGPSRR